MGNVRVIPGPINKDLLYLEKEHRAYGLFHKPSNDKALNVRRADRNLWSLIRDHPIQPRVMEFIRAAGFGGVFDCGYKVIDHGLITALVERWRPETHTFHLPIGEVTVTLQDVQVLWGLQVAGEAITGKEKKWDYNDARNKCVELLGFAPEPSNFKGAQIKSKYLRKILEKPVPNDAPVFAFIQRARVYILLLLGGVLFPDTSDTNVHMFMLCLIKDLDRCRQLSWGSAVLACLYRNLCKATSPDAIEITGPLMLLQLWCWCRLPGTSPILAPTEDEFSGKPYGAWWNRGTSFLETPAHMLIGFRSHLQMLQENEVIWTPYDAILNKLPVFCTSDQENWLCDTYIIFWEIVEECLPSRVMRQFHIVQTNPPTTGLSSIAQHRALHNITRRGASTKDWRNHNQTHIVQWNNRSQNYVTGIFSHAPITVNGYIEWYWPRTVIFITNPGPSVENSSRLRNVGGNFEVAIDGISRMHQRAGSMMGTNPHSQPYVQEFFDMSQQYLHLTHADNRMHYRSTHVVDTNIEVPNVPPNINRLQRMPRRWRRRDAHTRAQTNEAGTSNQGERTPSYVNRNNSSVSFRNLDLDINIPWTENETQEEE